MSTRICVFRTLKANLTGCFNRQCVRAACALVFIPIAANAVDSDVSLLKLRLPSIPAVICADVSVGDVKCKMALDTGAEVTALDFSLKKCLGAEAGSANVLDGSVRNTTSALYHSLPIKTQGLSAENPLTISMDLGLFSRLVGEKLGGILSVGQFKETKVLIDNDLSTLEMHRGKWRIQKDFSEEPLLHEHSVPVFAASIEQTPCTIVVDTGSSGSIQLETSLFESLAEKGVITVAAERIRAETISGGADLKHGWFSKGELMGRNLTGIPVTSVKGVQGHSAVGLAWMWGFNYEIDFDARLFRYQVRKDATPPLDIDAMIGAALTYSEAGAGVQYLARERGATEDAGLTLGDTILRFDGLERSQIKPSALAETVARNAGRTIAVRFQRISDGKHVESTIHLPPPISAWNFPGREADARRKKEAIEKPQDASIRFLIPPRPTHLSAQMQFGSEALLMLIDTGAELSRIDSSLKKYFDPEKKEMISQPKLISTGLANGEAPEGHSEFRVQGNFENLEKLSARIGHTLGGILSMQSFGPGKLLISFTEKVVEFQTGGWQLNERGIQESNWETGRLPKVNCKLAGRNYEFKLNSIAPNCVTLGGHVFDDLKKAGVLAEATPEEREELFIGRDDVVNRAGWFLSGTLMGKALRGTTVFSQGPDGSKENGVGLQWLCGFDTEIDIEAKKLRYRPLGNPDPPEDFWDMLGAMFSFDEYGAVVATLRPDGAGAAELAGLNVGDLIEAVDGIRGDKLDAKTVAEIVALNVMKPISVEFIRPSEGRRRTVEVKLPAVMSPWNFSGKAAPESAVSTK